MYDVPLTIIPLFCLIIVEGKLAAPLHVGHVWLEVSKGRQAGRLPVNYFPSKEYSLSAGVF